MNFTAAVLFLIILCWCILSILTEDSVTVRVTIDAVIFAYVFDANLSVMNVENAHASKRNANRNAGKDDGDKNQSYVFSLREPIEQIVQHDYACTSYGGLCGVAFEIRGTQAATGQINYKSSAQICDCKGKNTCPTDINNPSRVYYQKFSSQVDETSPRGPYTIPVTYLNITVKLLINTAETKIRNQTITTRLSYCKRTSFPVRECYQNEVAYVARGSGLTIANSVGSLTCKCSGHLVMQKTFSNGSYFERKYTCGKATCNVNSSTPSVCQRVTNVGNSADSDILCQCPDGFICNIDSESFTSDKSTEFYCKRERNQASKRRTNVFNFIKFLLALLFPGETIIE